MSREDLLRGLPRRPVPSTGGGLAAASAGPHLEFCGRFWERRNRSVARAAATRSNDWQHEYYDEAVEEWSDEDDTAHHRGRDEVGRAAMALSWPGPVVGGSDPGGVGGVLVEPDLGLGRR